jgi:hypothetical protein
MRSETPERAPLVASPVLTAAVRLYAMDHYNDGGWDVIHECWEARQVAESLEVWGPRDREPRLAVDLREAVTRSTLAQCVGAWEDQQAEASYQRTGRSVREPGGEQRGTHATAAGGHSPEQYLDVLVHRLWFLHHHGLSVIDDTSLGTLERAWRALDALAPPRPQYVPAGTARED